MNDVESALRWMHRLLDLTEAGDVGDAATLSPDPGRAVGSCIRLMRARLGLEPLVVAVEHAQRVVAELQEDPHLKGAEDAVLPLLLVELGICQNWLGDLVAAEATLNAAVSLGRFRDLPVVAAAAASHLAFTEYMAGRERACVQVATEALDTLAALTWRTPFTEERARLALLLARLVDLPLSVQATPSPAVPVHAADLPTTATPTNQETQKKKKTHCVANCSRCGCACTCWTALQPRFAGPRVPMPPPSRLMARPEPRNRGSRYLSWASPHLELALLGLRAGRRCRGSAPSGRSP